MMIKEAKGPEELHEPLLDDDAPGELEDLPAGKYFGADLEEARALAQHEPRFERLVEGLQTATMGERVAAITAFFDQFSAAEIANLTLPPHLSQLRLIYLSSRPDWP